MDIDDFKDINDHYGHAMGDRLLAAVSGVIRHELRQMDILTRYAGDEFVAIMPMASSVMSNQIAERIRSTVEDHTFAVKADKNVRLGISFGVASFPDDGETTEELLSAAARKMQMDKHGRKTMLTLAQSPVSTIDIRR